MNGPNRRCISTSNRKVPRSRLGGPPIADVAFSELRNWPESLDYLNWIEVISRRAAGGTSALTGFECGQVRRCAPFALSRPFTTPRSISVHHRRATEPDENPCIARSPRSRYIPKIMMIIPGGRSATGAPRVGQPRNEEFPREETQRIALRRSSSRDRGVLVRRHSGR